MLPLFLTRHVASNQSADMSAHSKSAVRMSQGQRADGAQPQTGRTGRALRTPNSAWATDSFPEFILGWTIEATWRLIVYDMNIEFQTLEQGDLIERENASWIRDNMPVYEKIWQRYLGNDGRGQPVKVQGLESSVQVRREKFYQAHYSMMVALLQLRDIRDEFQVSLGQVNQANFVAEYMRVSRDVTAFMCFIGCVRDMMVRIDSSLQLHGDVATRFQSFYEQRNNYLHSAILSHRIDDDGLLSMAVPAGNTESNSDWYSKSLWSESDFKRFVPIPDFTQETLQKLLTEVNIALNQCLEALHNQMPDVGSTLLGNKYLRTWSMSKASQLSSTCDSLPSEGGPVSGVAYYKPKS